jgi:hypothetical protein
MPGIIPGSFDFAEARDAYTSYIDGHAFGKVVIRAG